MTRPKASGLRLSRPEDPQYQLLHAAVKKIEADGGDLYFYAQTVAAFWNVYTRPLERNGFGLSIAETSESMHLIESRFVFLPELPVSYSLWRLLVEVHEVRGAQVHDARLVAAMQANGLDRILTLNGADFKRYDGITVVHPSEI